MYNICYGDVKYRSALLQTKTDFMYNVVLLYRFVIYQFTITKLYNSSPSRQSMWYTTIH